VFPVRYKLDSYILFRINSVFKGLTDYHLSGVSVEWFTLMIRRRQDQEFNYQEVLTIILNSSWEMLEQCLKIDHERFVKCPLKYTIKCPEVTGSQVDRHINGYAIKSKGFITKQGKVCPTMAHMKLSPLLMLPPHIAKCTRPDSTTNDSPNHSWTNEPVHTSRSHRSLVIRVRGVEDGRCTSCSREVLLY
jgi:hypothetical protein